VTTASERFFSEGHGPLPISTVGVDDLLSESLDVSDLRLRPLGDFFLALLQYQLKNKSTARQSVRPTYCLAASCAFFSSFCLTILNSLYFKTRSSGTHSSQLKVKELVEANKMETNENTSYSILRSEFDI